MNNKIILGSAQFGMNYGINNTRGKIDSREVIDILSLAVNSGIDMVDTSGLYGDSEEVIGNFINQNRKRLRVITKIANIDTGGVENNINLSLQRLKSEALYGCLIHHFNDYKDNPDIFTQLKSLKSLGRIEKIGFSLYYPQELQFILDQNLEIDIVQFPYNIFDRRFESYFEILKRRNIEFHARSVFLQGLVFKDPAQLNGNFVKISGKLAALRKISQDSFIPLSSICLNFVVLNNLVGKAVVGVDSLKNLMELLTAVEFIDATKKIYRRLKDFEEDDEGIILPLNWQPLTS